MSEPAIKVAIIGTGSISKHHAKTYLADPQVTLVGLADIDAERVRLVAESWGAGRPYTDYREMLEAERPDAVSICTIPVAHREPALACLERGIHVLCEKPLGYNAAEAREMVEAARRSGALLMTAFCHRFHEPVVKAKALIDRGRLGRVIMYRNRFGGRAMFGDRWFGSKAKAGGGTLLDTAIHSADLFRFLVGDAIAVSATVDTLVQQLDVEDCGVMLLRAANGAMGVIEASWSTPHSVNDIEIYGENGAAIVDYDGGRLRYMTSGMKRWQTARPKGPDRFEMEVRHFLACVRGESRLQVTGEDGLRAQLIIEAGYRSSAEGTWVRLQ